ncbi:hypothetical protein G6N74_03780 [Mesorhizobium sp. CGMCC 1.15528]|uniref:Uncharacterized protein n=1 Tax=Mesorhizobium zhangyense TaxID=1776730 RepID=A0A7C9R4Z2_9HYPH|nr:hypothetical protein [Mesorhizobium zhangyense]NGN40174.1 hypothetical protein [Mesorhizobium zhangyense]
MEAVHTHYSIFCPEELQMLCRVVKKTCDWHGLGYGGQDAKDIATLAMSLFASGQINEEFLFKRLRREPLVRRTHRAFADLATSQRRPGRRMVKRLQGAAH